MPIAALAILIGVLVGGATATVTSKKHLSSMLPSWISPGDVIPNRLTVKSGGGGGGGGAGLEDALKQVLHGLAVSAAGVSQAGMSSSVSSQAAYAGSNNPTPTPSFSQPATPSFAGLLPSTSTSTSTDTSTTTTSGGSSVFLIP